MDLTQEVSQERVLEQLCDYAKWIAFVKPKLHNMCQGLKGLYVETQAPANWVEWITSKNQTWFEDETALTMFVEAYLKEFWYVSGNKAEAIADNAKKFHGDKFHEWKKQELEKMVKSGEMQVPEGVDWRYEADPKVLAFVNLYMALLCDSHDHFVLKIKNA
jgi:hypothetical protein